MIRWLKIKFVFINMLIVTVMLAVILGMVLQITRYNIEEQGNRIIQSIHENSSHKAPGPRDNRVPYFTVTVTPEGVMSISSNTFFDRTSDQEMLNIAKSVYEGQERKGVLTEHELRFSRKPIHRGEEIVFMDVSMQHGIMVDLIKTCFHISVVSYLLFFIISVALAQWAIRPVEVAWKSQRQFLADASHELKTPLTVIMTNAELLQEKDYEVNAKEQFAASILAMSRQMRGLVEGLLELSRVDNGIVKSTFTRLDLSELINDSLLPFEPMFFEKGMELNTEVEAGICLQGSRNHLMQVAEILLDNAVKYGSANTPVDVKLNRQGRHALLSVATAGEEISRQDLKSIFRRFYRIDQARTMNGSYGLGLSIAESIVKEHRGKIWAESKDGVNVFYVQLKAQKPEC